ALSGGGVFRSDGGNNTTAVVSIGALNTSTTFSGAMVANGTQLIAVTKVGTGTLTLSGANTYTGATTITAGALSMNNASGVFNSPVTVAGGTFGGTGSSKAALTVGTGMGSGATLAPGDPSANLGIGTYTTTGALVLKAD